MNTIEKYGDKETLRALIAGTLEEYETDQNVSVLAFYKYQSLKKIKITSELQDLIPSQFCFGCGSLEEICITSESLRSINDYAFADCTKLSRISAPIYAQNISSYAFNNTKITEINDTTFPNLTSIGTYTFGKNSEVTKVVLSKVVNIGNYPFSNCPKLKILDIYGNVSDNSILRIPEDIVGAYKESNRTILEKFIIRSNRVPQLLYDKSFNLQTSMTIYVLDNLVDSYKSATNWSAYASKIKPISELPEE